MTLDNTKELENELDNLSPAEREKLFDEINVFFLLSWQGLLEIDQAELADKLGVTRVYCNKILNGKYPFSKLLKRKVLNVIPPVTKEKLYFKDDKVKAAEAVVKLYLSKMPTERKFDEEFVKAFVEGASKEELTKLNKLVKEAIKQLKEE